MKYCVDASAILDWLIGRGSRTAVREFFVDCFNHESLLVAPPLLFAESTSVLRRYVHLKEIASEDAKLALEDLLALPILVVHSPDVYLRALEFARRRGHAKAYDVQYLAVAELERATLVTADAGMYANADALGVGARLLT